LLQTRQPFNWCFSPATSADERRKAALSCRFFNALIALMKRFMPPLVDRLLDAAPFELREALRPSMTVEELKAAVARDVESLLNSRRGTLLEVTKLHMYADQSVFAFGLEDFSAKSISSAHDRNSICRSIEQAISNHEPRLLSVRVALEANVGGAQKVKFSIQAFLMVHPLHEPVSFDAVLQTTTQTYAVQNIRRVS
jgi:type VI secretion system protein ImpF